MATDFTGLIPHGWTGGEAVTKWWRGKHLHLYRLRKECAQCKKEMTLDVTKAAILGTAKNAGLHLSRCTQCRAASKSEGPTSRPFTRDDPADRPAHAPAVDALTSDEMEELERLRDWEGRFFNVLKSVQGKFPDTTMLNIDERVALLIKAADDLYVNAKTQFEEIQVLKAKLAKYDLPTAFENKMPWGS